MSDQEKREIASIEKDPKKKRRKGLTYSFILFVVIPSIIGTIYTTFFASNRYVSEAGFSVRSITMGGGNELLGAFTGLASSGSTTSDSYMVLNYLESRDFLERLQKDFDFKAVYGSKDIDLFSRLIFKQHAERVLKYWQRRIRTSFDSSSGIIHFEIQGFSPHETKRVSDLAVQYVDELINTLSEKARQDAVGYAEREVALAEQRQLAVLKKIREFRSFGKTMDPMASAAVQIEILAGLEKQLIEIQTRIHTLEPTVDDDAPSIKNLQRQAASLKQQIASQTAEIRATGSDQELVVLLAAYEELQVEKEFAQKAYASALSSLEAARVEASRQQRYLAVYSKPALADFALYPRKIVSPIFTFIFSIIFWGIGSLIVYAVRDHLS
jgi:capsular polysaccharide transport system permease protein